MTSVSSERLSLLFGRFPRLDGVVRRLNAACIPFAIGGSGCLFVLGNERLPDDVDIYLPDDRHDEADRLFGCASFPYRSAQEEVRNSNPGGDHAIQLTSGLVLRIEGKAYGLALTSDVISHGLCGDHEGEPVRFYPPEDVLLIKALLRRGPEVGKHDLEDIERFLKVYPGIRKGYLARRIRDLGAEARVGTAFA